MLLVANSQHSTKRIVLSSGKSGERLIIDPQSSGLTSSHTHSGFQNSLVLLCEAFSPVHWQYKGFGVILFIHKHYWLPFWCFLRQKMKIFSMQKSVNKICEFWGICQKFRPQNFLLPCSSRIFRNIQVELIFALMEETILIWTFILQVSLL